MRIQDQIAQRSSLIWIYNVYQRGFKNILQKKKVIGALRVNKCEFSVHTVTIIMNYAHDNLLTLYQILNKTWGQFHQRVYDVFLS